MSHLLEKLAVWKGFTALVVGDFMLDQLMYGNADRLAPDSPVPILHVQRTEDRPGGAANVCLDLIAMRANVHALGVVGDDREADLLRSALVAAGVQQGGLVTDATRPTTQALPHRPRSTSAPAEDVPSRSRVSRPARRAR
jgi:D-beta-D-heptose 7-phosphate kinase / D-beta-D-heptose 1-phosphate adenosyltransferase